MIVWQRMNVVVTNKDSKEKNTKKEEERNQNKPVLYAITLWKHMAGATHATYPQIRTCIFQAVPKCGCTRYFV